MLLFNICLCIQMKKNYLFLYLFLFVDYQKKKKKYKELELTKLKFHITRNPNLVNSSTIEEEKRPLRSSFVFTKNSSLVSSSIVLHGTRVYQAQVPCGIFSIKKSTSTQILFYFIYIFYFMKLECLKLDLHRKLEFYELEFQKSGILLLIL